MSTVYGYLYLAEDGAEDGAERDMLLGFLVPEENLFADRDRKGENGRREYRRGEYWKMVDLLCPGDTVVIMSLESLGGTYGERLTQWELITKEKWADIVVLGQPQFDTRPSAEALDGNSVAVLVLEALKREEQKRKDAFRTIQGEGIAAARERGVRFGRPRKPVPDHFRDVKEEWERKEINSRDAAKKLGVSQQTFLRWAHEKETEAGRIPEESVS